MRIVAANMKRVVLLILCGILSNPAFCQNNEEEQIPLSHSDLHFDTEIEAQLFESLQKGDLEKEAFLRLFLIAHQSTFEEEEFISFQSRIKATTEALLDAKVMKKKPSKKIQLIYDEVHERFLKKYEMNPSFTQLSSAGIYNCVTASFLFTLVLDQLQMNYSIKEAPQHVYLVAYPNSEAVLIESTNPQQGYLEYSNDYKTKFVQTLRDSKIISELEYRNSTVDQLFDQYYFTEKDISLKELCGVYYANIGIDLLQKQKNQEAFECFKKAYMLYPSEQIKFNMMIACMITLENTDFEQAKSLENYCFANRFLHKGIEEDLLYMTFLKVTDMYLTKGKDEDFYDDFYVKYSNAIQDSAYRHRVDYAYLFQKGRVYLIKGDYKNGYEFTKKALQLEPHNIDVHNNLINGLANLLQSNQSSSAYLEDAEQLMASFPDLADNVNMKRLVARGYLFIVYDAYVQDNGAQGKVYLERFENFIEKAEVQLEDDLVGRAYSEAAIYYFKKGNDKLTKKIITKGLSLAPGSRELQVRKSMVYN